MASPRSLPRYGSVAMAPPLPPVNPGPRSPSSQGSEASQDGISPAATAASENFTTGSPFPPIGIAHGVYDPVIPVEFGREARARLEAAGADVLYLESPIEHSIDPQAIAQFRALVLAADSE